MVKKIDINCSDFHELVRRNLRGNSGGVGAQSTPGGLAKKTVLSKELLRPPGGYDGYRPGMGAP